MSTSGLVMMIVTMVTVTVITVYFFVRVLKTPPKPEPDSFEDNDDQKR